jgi:acyl carrier protein
MSSESANFETMKKLIPSLKSMVIRECNVEGFSPEQIQDHEPIIGGPMPLDSLDAVEIVAALERSFGIRLESAGSSRHIFKSFNVMAEYVLKNSEPDRVSKFLN